MTTTMATIYDMSNDANDSVGNESTSKALTHEHSDQQRFMELLTPLGDALLRFAYSLTRNYEEAQDITSEAILKAWEQFHTLNNEAAFKPWIFTIARRAVYRHTERKRRFFSFGTSPHAALKPSPDNLPDDLADAQLLYAALDKLSDDQREAVMLFDVLGFSLEEIRQMQGGSLSGVKSRLVRGREKLAALMGVRNDIL